MYIETHKFRIGAPEERHVSINDYQKEGALYLFSLVKEVLQLIINLVFLQKANIFFPERPHTVVVFLVDYVRNYL